MDVLEMENTHTPDGDGIFPLVVDDNVVGATNGKSITKLSQERITQNRKKSTYPVNKDVRSVTLSNVLGFSSGVMARIFSKSKIWT
jgi:hypothetical protein